MLKKISSVTAKNVHHHEGAFLHVNNLCFRYNDEPVLDEVTFELKGGERVAIVGPNGAGKSTLFKIIAGVEKPFTGYVQLGGHDPSDHICIAYLPQRSDVDWDFPVTVKDVVMMGRTSKMGLFKRAKAVDWDFVEDCLSAVNMTHLAERQIEELSGGQQQRMFIAQALAQEAELLMMDEPLSGLDVTSQDEVFAILDELQKRDVTVLVSTHDLGLATNQFDLALLLNKQVIDFGLPDKVFSPEHLKHAYGGQLHLLDNPTDPLLSR